MISTDHLEQAYMAVTYLAAGFNRKHGEEYYAGWDDGEEDHGEEDGGEEDHGKEDGGEEDHRGEWTESAWKIPVIMENELRQGMSGENDPFSMGGALFLGNQKNKEHPPYWMDCTRHSVCIVCQDDFQRFDFGPCRPYDDDLFQGLDYFKENDKVYIIVEKSAWQWEDEDGEVDDFCDFGDEKWNYLVLSYAADEVFVRLTEEIQKKYYKLLFQGKFAEKGLLAARGFDYGKLVNIVMAMRERNKCQLVENIVNYAVKDLDHVAGYKIRNQDFSFIDRFCRMDKFLVEGTEEEAKQSARERMAKELVGMEEVKQQVYNIVNVMKYNKVREKMGIRGGSYHNAHLMLGAPGTAKTTVAQLMGQIMVEEGLLPDNRFICINGAELKGRYVGHSAPKTKKIFEENDIIVIDEAYSLVGDYGKNDPFSKEALAQLIVEVENHSKDKLIIFAGYGGRGVSEKNDKMKDFLDANPGLRSRITSTIYFDSYTVPEMVNVFMRIAKNQGYEVEETSVEILKEHFKKRVGADNFGNGREARSLLETAVVFVAKRVLGKNKKKYTREEMQTVTCDDIRQAVFAVEQAEEKGVAGKVGRRIGFTGEG